jgi:hypothetical protein
MIYVEKGYRKQNKITPLLPGVRAFFQRYYSAVTGEDYTVMEYKVLVERRGTRSWKNYTYEEMREHRLSIMREAIVFRGRAFPDVH